MIIPKTPSKKRPRTHAEINEFRRKSLIEGALRSLAENGVSGTTVSTICTAAGSSRGLLGHYFSSKDEVMVAALDYLFGQISVTVRESLDRFNGTAVETLHELPSVMFTAPVFTQLNRTAFLALWHETRFNDQVRVANRQLYRNYINRMERMFIAAAAELGVQFDPRRAALGYIALSDGLWLGLSIHDDVITGEQAIEICQNYISRELQQN
ncbi:TetR family transcriptional regulator C-terminal domain-containing protein [Roseovarius pelagicus]|uniref:TetR family transcriptional regulator C-terminal domain-containing protein n=1 Tax=Roseovarius pelagicus TaxID=2980108 RepID=A0ABY6DAB3_9RHOB|nr:TetR family transcriptional regulator C-terminal domain-containing protein [Roseovarius pelagicus]UXX83035.1 TetR family transcriptional regulator C-terminal domain-containing protein [Roseovarius pelagicus]